MYTYLAPQRKLGQPRIPILAQQGPAVSLGACYFTSPQLSALLTCWMGSCHPPQRINSDQVKAPSSGRGRYPGVGGKGHWLSSSPHIPLCSLMGQGKLLRTGRASREVAGCAEAEEVQAVARSSHSQGRGPSQQPQPPSLATQSTPLTFLKRGQAHAQHTSLNSLLPIRCRSLPRALVRNQKQPCPSLPEQHRARMTWKGATPPYSQATHQSLSPSLFIRVSNGNIGEPSCGTHNKAQILMELGFIPQEKDKSRQDVPHPHSRACSTQSPSASANGQARETMVSCRFKNPGMSSQKRWDAAAPSHPPNLRPAPMPMGGVPRPRSARPI